MNEPPMSQQVLMLNPLPPVESALQSDCTLHRYWSIADRGAFLAQTGPRIRVLTGYSYAGSTPIDAALIGALPKLELIAIMGAGHESVDLAAARARGIAVTNSGPATVVDVAEHAIGLMIDVARAISAADRFVRAGRWPKEQRMPMYRRLSGRRLGIFGLGRIGLEIARRAEAFVMPVAYHNRRPRPELRYRHVASLVELASECDVLVCAAPGGAATHHAVDRAVLDALGPRGILINVGRGSIVDEDALVAALEEGRLGGAGLDVFEHEPWVPEALLSMTNVVLQPHHAGATEEGIAGGIAAVLHNVRALFAGEPLVNVI